MAVIQQTSTELRTLRALSSGDVVSPADQGYDEARAAWNLAANQRPAAVVFPENDSDVAFAMAYAREAGLRVSVQGTGHNPMPLGEMADSVLIRTNRMRQVEIDPSARRARVQAGAIWSDVAPHASAHGLAALAGSSPDVGIVGYSLGGGIGYLGRKHGIQTNSVTAIELVTPDGEHVRTDADHDPDLFWALRGGGGNFGVVTALEFRLYPVSSLYGGWLVWPWEDSQRVIERWVEWTRTAPDEITSMARILQLPPLPDVPEMLRGRQIVVVSAAYLGTKDEGDWVLGPLRELRPEIDTFATMEPVGLSHLHGDPETPVPGVSDTSLVDDLPQAAIDTFVAKAGPGSGSSLLAAELRQMGGAFARSGEGHGALSHIDAGYVAFGVGMTMNEQMTAAVERDSAELIDAMRPYGHGRSYSNFAERAVDASSFYAEETYRRLRAIRARVDPDGLMRANHVIA
ncbi:MAG TPA: FAD-binding oxidoreductase [Thermoleophilaceae bacterium]